MRSFNLDLNAEETLYDARNVMTIYKTRNYYQIFIAPNKSFVKILALLPIRVYYKEISFLIYLK